MFARNTLLRKTCVPPPHTAPPPQPFYVAVGSTASILITVHTGLARDDRFSICCHYQLTWSIEYPGLRRMCGKVEYRWVNSISALSFHIATLSASLTWLFSPPTCHMLTVARYKKSYARLALLFLTAGHASTHTRIRDCPDVSTGSLTKGQWIYEINGTINEHYSYFV